MLAVPLTDYYEEVRRYLTCPEEVKDDLIYDVNRKVMDLNAIGLTWTTMMSLIFLETPRIWLSPF